MNRSALRAWALAAAIAGAWACGKKGPPQPPLRPVPAVVGSFAAERIDSSINLRFVVPATNLDGSTPAAIDRVEIYAVTLAASAPALTREQIVVPGNLTATVPVSTGRGTPADPSSKPLPVPGNPVSHAEEVKLTATGDAPVRYYVAVGAAGRRRGVLSPVLKVPLGGGPAPPGPATVEYTEKDMTVSWQAVGSSQRFIVSAVERDGSEKRLTAEPVETSRFSMPVKFGVEQCVVVRVVDVVGPVTLIGQAGERACETPVDRFPPTPPTGLLAVSGNEGNELVWVASASADVTGYVVLRGEGANGTLQPLTPAPITATTYRDGNVRSGVTYIYAVRAVDNATNRSDESNRASVTAKQP